MIGETHIAGICVVGGVTSRLFGIGKGPFTFTFAVVFPVEVVGDRRGVGGRDDDRG